MSLFTAMLMHNIWRSVLPLIPAALLVSLASPLVRISPRSHGDWQTWASGSVLTVCAINLCHQPVPPWSSTQQCEQLPHCLGAGAWKRVGISQIFSVSNIRSLASGSCHGFSYSDSCVQTDIVRPSPLRGHQKLEQLLDLTLPPSPAHSVDGFLSSFLKSSFTQGSVTSRGPSTPVSSFQSSTPSQLSFLSWRSRPQPPSLLKFNLGESIPMGPGPSSQRVASPWVSCLDVCCPGWILSSVKEGGRNPATSHQPERRGIQQRKVPVRKLRQLLWPQSQLFSQAHCTWHPTTKWLQTWCTCGSVYTGV